MFGKQRRERKLGWGTIRSESQWDEDGAVTLQSAESEDLSALSDSVREFVASNADRFGFSADELQAALRESDWLLGYVCGASLACLRDSDGPADTSSTGFASRVCGELMGGGIKNKVAAFEYLTERSWTADFIAGRAEARRAWRDQSVA